VNPRTSIIIDNDFGGDPDGLFQLAHHLLSPSAEILGIVNSHVMPTDPNWPTNGDSIKKGIEDLQPILEFTGQNPQVFGGLHEDEIQHQTPVNDKTLEFLVNQVESATQTVVYACGGPMTQLARLIKAKPKNLEALRVIWIGGSEHAGPQHFPPGGTHLEYNLAADPESVEIVFANPQIELWQVPRDSYRRATVSVAELNRQLAGKNPLSSYLLDSLKDVYRRVGHSGYQMGETYCLGDSPLVLLSVLENPFEPTPAGSQYVEMERPNVSLNGEYSSGGVGRTRVFSNLDTRLMFEDMFAKFGGASGAF
jgi:inosine-uridine nucleoside N-ribohydrolase